MPRQLRNAKRRRSRHSEPRPTIELMPAININELRHAIPRNYGRISEPDVGLKYPQIARLRLQCNKIEILDYYGRIQSFTIKWVRTYFGRHRPILICNCSRGAIRLFARYGTYACWRCHKAVYTSQRQDSKGRKRLAACKLRLELGGLPSTDEPIPLKTKWKHCKRYYRLRNQVQALESAIKPKRFDKPIDIRAPRKIAASPDLCESDA
jgi:hypothetical protein